VSGDYYFERGIVLREEGEALSIVLASCYLRTRALCRVRKHAYTRRQHSAIALQRLSVPTRNRRPASACTSEH
jgi:hypothetical protein